MNTASLILQLKRSSLYAECPKCGGEFRLSKEVLFDGTKPFPKQALEAQKSLLEGLTEREDGLKKKKERATTGAQTTTTAVNIGKNLEKILPTLRDFNWCMPDCRFLGDPIDLLVFNGLSMNAVDRIDFIEVKSGKAKLNDHQKAIKDAVDDKKVAYKEFI